MARARVLRWVLVALSATLAVVLIVAGNTVAGVLIGAIAVVRASLLLSRPRRRTFAGQGSFERPAFGNRAGAGPGGRGRFGDNVPMSTLSVSGLSRQYIVHRPARPSTGAPMPLVVVMHGGFGSAAQAQRAYGWDALADSQGFVVVYPNGTSRTWNAGTCCGPAARDQIDDVGFIDALLVEMQRAGDIDADRVYATGMSNGAMMAYRLACQLPGRFAAIGPVAGTMTVPCTSAKPISVCHIHGLADQNVLFGGGVSPRGFAKDARPSVASVIAGWRTIDGCGPVAARDDGPVHTETAQSARGDTVTLITVAGAGHQWPGSRPAAARAVRALGLDPPTMALDATATLWQFFSAHPRRA